MESIPENKLLKFHPDTLEVVRREVHLDKPGEMKAAINILKEWIQQQPHFKKKDFNEHFLEITIIVAKGSIERSKRQIDKVCTMRSLWPHFFNVTDIRRDLAEIIQFGSLVIMPKLTKQYHRVIVVQLEKTSMTSDQILQHYKTGVCVAEYIKAHDYVCSYQYILDLRPLNMADFLTAFNLTDFRQIFSILVECYGMRLKGIHLVSGSKLIDTFVGILKQFLKPKLIQRLRVYDNLNELVDVIGEEYLPQELGGTERPIKQIQEEWLEEMSKKKYLEYLREMNEGGTIESLRPKGSFSEDYAGMPGTFRLLTVD